MTLRTIVVDDSIIFRKVMRDALSAIPGVEVVDIARDGSSAVDKIVAAKPDLVTLDIEMPGLNGLEVLEELDLRGIQTNVIVVSAHTSRGAEVTTQALSMGALDFILKPDNDNAGANLAQLKSELARLLKMVKAQPQLSMVSSSPAKSETLSAPIVARAPVRTTKTTSVPRPVECNLENLKTPKFPHLCHAIFIGISTGGPKALASVIPKLPATFTIPIVIVQHMPPLFTATMAKSLDNTSALNVVEATHGMPLAGGGVYIAPGGKQLGVKADARGNVIAVVTDDPPIKSCKPSVDYMMSSVPSSIARNSLAVIMTGMGDDGRDGVSYLRQNGCTVWAQSAESCTVYGMPRQIIENGLADFAFDLDDLPNLLSQLAYRAGGYCPVPPIPSTTAPMMATN
ncbi:chemotaxis-specific protein-glutamate methyltransferase CheB [Neorhodopirellula pilleata]|uniref:Protein-glutamate methylesterase/protein-glutamine glutaminase n=1 Tax=Neorhodopirellula pilleata TaxID=2714738 RepID=A0A5C6A8E4_9BACT|nr:chemotaxis-specific protein-glutamate methyltransferase CheB [Neorhodopirellula pilleata]TWT96234.1 Chemotaxis response regulator protein-glutamate methylesterase [Neorhodopirellula pilleata]